MTKLFQPCHCERSVAIAKSSNRSAFTLAEGATHVGTCDNIRKNAFTLAEVLITLAIIGVVAAMTIPTLITKYEEKAIITQVTKLYSDLSNAYRLNIATGDGTLRTIEIIKNFRTMKICEKTYVGCADNKYTELNGSTTSWGKTDSFPVNYALIQDGKIFRYIDGATDCSLSAGENLFYCGEFSVDVNGNKGPNVIGKDVFFFYITKKGVLPFGTRDETRMSFEKECAGGNLRGFGCTAWIIQNNNIDYLHCGENLSWDGAHSCKEAK